MIKDEVLPCAYCGQEPIAKFIATVPHFSCGNEDCFAREARWAALKEWNTRIVPTETKDAFEQFAASAQHDKNAIDHLVATLGRLLNDLPFNMADMHSADSLLNQKSNGIYAEALRIVLNKK